MASLSLRNPLTSIFDTSKIINILCVLLVIFPKGGFKIGNIPLTWGYLFLAVVAILQFLQKSWIIQSVRFESLLFLLPFQFVILATLILYGISDVGMGISLLVSFYFLPLLFFLVFSDTVEKMDLEKFLSMIKKSIRYIAFYGIFLFLLKKIGGSFLEIPFLTTNWGDSGKIELKHIDRGTAFKLISTYNNGNIYGICVLMLLPLYSYIEKKRIFKWVVKLSLLLTLSRTVWIGLIFHELFSHALIDKNTKKLIIKTITSIGIIFLFLFLFSHFFDFPLSFFLDRSFGGRKEYLYLLGEEFFLFPNKPFPGFFEMVYAGVAYSFGWLGLMAFLLGISGSLFLNTMRNGKSPLHRCVAIGLFNYLFVSLSDGAILYIPTMAFFWFLNSLLARKQLKSV